MDGLRGGVGRRRPACAHALECSTAESFKTLSAPHRRRVAGERFYGEVLFEGLPPGQDIFYRVRFEDLALSDISGETQVGHFGPRQHTKVRYRLSVGVIPPARAGHRCFPRGCEPTAPCSKTPDFFIHSGDHIYADVSDPFRTKTAEQERSGATS